MIAWTFKNKIRSVDDGEFLNYLRNKDKYPQKLIYLIEQEARKRFFSNKEFNGQDDEYVHPVIESQIKQKRHKRVIKTSLSLSIVLVVSGLLYFVPSEFYDSISYPHIPSRIAQLFESGEMSPNTPTSATAALIRDDDNTKNETEIESPAEYPAQSNALSVAGQKDKTADKKPADKPKQIADSNPAEKQRIVVSDGSTGIEKNTRNSIATPTPKPAPEKIKEQTAAQEDAKTEVIEQTTKPTQVDEKVESPTADKPKITEERAWDDQPETKPDILTQEKATSSDVEDITNAQMLSNTLLRQYIPFLNDWAFKQTQQPEISDYYVESNSIVNFKITKPHSDSIDAFRDKKLKLLMQNYWKSLDAELGTDFPRIPIAIRFLRFDDDL